jgi:beta-lactamase superfamily II metal-dependent hydrolase
MKIKFLKANNGDSILLSFKDENNVPRNILIDGGMGSTFYHNKTKKKGELYEVIENIKKREEKIDLLILTHIDEDHIGGILKWFSMKKDAHKIIENVWFNSGKTIADYLEEKENKELELFLSNNEDSLTSVRQGDAFEKYINLNKIWDNKLIHDEIKTINKFGLKIQILSPSVETLKKLLKEYKKPEHNYFTDGGNNDWEKTISQFLEEESEDDFVFEEDSSVPNGSSIAFLLEYDRKIYIFLGDAHPSVIIKSLKSCPISATKSDPIKVELLKVSHHSSSYNTNEELLSLIRTDNYIICTDGTRHGLPNKRTLARIIKNNSNANIYFNYEKLINYMICDADRKDFPDVKWRPLSLFPTEK